MNPCVQIYGSGNAAGILYPVEQELSGASSQFSAGNMNGSQAVHNRIHGRDAVKAAYHDIFRNLKIQLSQRLDEDLGQYVIGAEKSWGRQFIFFSCSLTQPS